MARPSVMLLAAVFCMLLVSSVHCDSLETGMGRRTLGSRTKRVRRAAAPSFPVIDSKSSSTPPASASKVTCSGSSTTGCSDLFADTTKYSAQSGGTVTSDGGGGALDSSSKTGQSSSTANVVNLGDGVGTVKTWTTSDGAGSYSSVFSSGGRP